MSLGRAIHASAASAIAAGLLVALPALPARAAARPRMPAATGPGPTAAHPYQGLRRLTVATIPPVAGARFAVDGREFVANRAGVASTLVTKDQRLQVRAARSQHLTVVSPVIESEPGVRARFAGWSGHGQYRGGAIPEEYERATFDVDYLTSFKFATPGGAPVSSRTLQTMRLRSSTGQRILLRRFAPVWLSGSRAATDRNGLQVHFVSYAIDSVTTSGALVVHRAQQRFFPSQRQTVSVPLLLYTVTFAPHDAFFGSSVGSGVSLAYPDGTSRRFAIGRDGTVTLRRLPRGTYHAVVDGAGPQMAQQLTVSQSTRLSLQVLTWPDAAVLVSLVLTVLVALLLAGRYVRRRSQRGGRLRFLAPEPEARVEPEMAGTL